MPHDALNGSQVSRLLVDPDGASVAEAVQGLVGEDVVALGLVACPQGLEVIGAEWLLLAAEYVDVGGGSVYPRLDGHADVVRDGHDSVPSALVAVPRQRDFGESIVEVAPVELADLLMGAEQATIGEEASEVEIGVEGLDVFEYSGDIADRLVQRGLLSALGDLRDGVGEASCSIGWLQDGREALALVVEGGGGEEA